MKISSKICRLLWGVTAVLSLSSCHGIFGGIYDEPVEETSDGFGFIKINEATRTGPIYIDAQEYAKWNYISLKDKKVVTALYTEQQPENWDFAVHRYDAKTNGASVFESEYYDLTDISSASKFSGADFVADEWTTNKITIDMSQMMEGIIKYAEDFYNPCLSKWLNVDTSSMPPVYTLSEKVYILKLQDGTFAALKLSDFMNTSGIKGFMTIDYLYPVTQ